MFKELSFSCHYSKTCLKRPLKRTPKIGFQYRPSLNRGKKYWRMLQGEHYAILSTSIKLLFPIKTLVLSIFKWPLKTGFTVVPKSHELAYIFQLSIEMSCLPPDSKTRLPIHPLLQGDTWKIISK